jgi:hypothetical protein|tara:strand:+ start:3489 stop:3803 length:315 start_codon:yes stop_codon:yes gene_type:complete
MDFQKTVLVVATVLFSLLMFVIVVMLQKNKNMATYPPEIAKCPDYWDMEPNNDCVDIKSLNTSCPNRINFDTPEYLGNKGKIAKCKWAKGCGASWDGITNVELC